MSLLFSFFASRRISGAVAAIVLAGMALWASPAALFAQSARPGLGAIPYDGGVTFRVWAPFADSVGVTGQFNGWSSTANPLVSEGNGNWSADVGGARVGQEYKYVIARGSTTLWKKDPRAPRVVHSDSNSIIYDHSAFDWGDSSFGMPWWNDLVVYEMHVGSFNPPASGVGTFYTAAERFDYLQDLGVNAIKLMPVNEFPGDYSWGYNPSDPFAVESGYGGPDGLKYFIREAHKRGIAVLVDVIYNHFGPSDLDLWRFDGWYEGSGGGIYFYNDYRRSTPWGDTRPDYGRGEVRQYIRDNALMWLTEFRADGLRWDATAFMRYSDGMTPSDLIADGASLIQWINNDIKAAQPWKISIAEDMKGHWHVTQPTGSGGLGFDSQWDPSFHHSVAGIMIAGSDSDRDMNALRDRVGFKFNNDAIQRVIYTESHDEVANGRSRKPEEIFPGNAGSWFARKRSTLGAVLVFTSPGIPMLFMGQEFLMDGWFSDDRPLDWSRLETYAGIHHLYRDLMRLRRNWYNHTAGLRGQHVNVYHVNNTDKMLAYHRWSEGGAGDDVVVVTNWTNRAWTPAEDYRIGFPRGGTWNVAFNSDSSRYSSDYTDAGSSAVFAEETGRDGLSHSASISIAPYSALIFTQGTPQTPSPSPTPTPTPPEGPDPIYEPEGLHIPGQWNGWTNPPDNPAFSLQRREFGIGPTGYQWTTTIHVQSTGGDTTGGAYDWGFFTGPPGNPWQNKWTGAAFTPDSSQTVTWQASVDNSLTVADGNHYTFVWVDNGYLSNTTVAVMRTTNAPVSIAAVQDGTLTPQITLSAPKSPEERILVRYSSDAWATSAIAEATGTGTTYNAAIPNPGSGMTVSYYAFSTTMSNAALQGTHAIGDNTYTNHDLFTLAYNNNAGANYSVTMEGPTPTPSPSPTPTPTLTPGETPTPSPSPTPAPAAFAVIGADAALGAWEPPAAARMIPAAADLYTTTVFLSAPSPWKVLLDQESGWEGGDVGRLADGNQDMPDAGVAGAVTYYFNLRDDTSRGWFPPPPTLGSTALATLDWVAVGEFQDWDPDSAQTRMMYRSDGVFTCQFEAATDLEDSEWFVVSNTQPSWDGEIKLGITGWAVDPGQVENAVLNANEGERVLLEFDAWRGRLRSSLITPPANPNAWVLF